MTKHREESFPSKTEALDDGVLVGRRRMLTTLALAAPSLAAACALPTVDLPADNQDPDGVGDDAGADAGGAVDDTGSTSPTDSGGTSCGPGVRLGAVTDFALGQWKKVTVGSTKFNVGRDAKGLWAYSNTCTHNNVCQIGSPGSTTGAITCPCHGAQFDGNGKVTRGPALRALNNYKLTICGADVYVDKTQVVPMGTRTAV